MMKLKVRGGRPLHGDADVPPDKSVLHRALILGALGSGPCKVHPLGMGEDNRSTLAALSSLGVSIQVEGDAAILEGVGGARGLSAPSGAIDCGNSGTTMRLLCGVLASVPGLRVTLDGDASLRRRPMDRLRPLEAMSARLLGSTEDGRLRAPFTIEGASLRGFHHRLEVASAQVKSAILLAGLGAEGSTTVTEPRVSRDHSERMLAARGVQLTRSVSATGEHTVALEPLETPWSMATTEVPPDISSAAFLLAAAAVTDGAIRVRTGVNPTRTGVLDALRGMGVQLVLSEEEEVGGEPVASVTARRFEPLVPQRWSGQIALRSIDELPLLAGLAVFADGVSEIADAAELRVKESDRIAEVVQVLSALGGDVEARPDGLIIRGSGGSGLRPGRVDGAGDHRIAMTAAVVALGIPGETVIEGAEVIGVSFPGFVDTLRALGADIELA